MRCCCATISNTTAGRSRRCRSGAGTRWSTRASPATRLYNLLARDFAPAARATEEPRQAARRDAAFPRAGARSARARARAEGARGNRGEAERRARCRCSTARSPTQIATPSRGRAGSAARKRREGAQRAVATPDLAREAAARRKPRAISGWAPSSTTGSCRSRCSRRCRAQEIRARAESELAATRARDVRDRAPPCSRAGAAARRRPRSRAPRSSSAPSRPRSSSPTPNDRSATRVLDTARAALIGRHAIRARRRTS